MADRKPPAPSGEAIDTKLVRKLADILEDTGLSEIEVENETLRIRVTRQAAAATVTYAAPAPVAHAPAAAAPSAAPAAAAPAGEVVKSPMVGTAYLSPQPGAEAFVRPGDKVRAGQTLLIIEAMKTMNPIPCPRDGTVLEILINDSEPVEFGEPLVVLD